MSHPALCQYITMTSDQVRVWGRTSAGVKLCADEIGGHPYESLQDALRDADVVATVTMATEPLVRGQWLKHGAVIICG